MLHVIASMVLIIASLASFLGAAKRLKIIALPVYLTYFISLGIYFVSDYFTGDGINSAVLFHLKYGLGGAGFSEYKQIIFFALVYSLAVGILLLLFCRLPTVFRDRHKYRNRRIAASSVLMLGWGCYLNPAVSQLYALQPNMPTTIINPADLPDHFVEAKAVKGKGKGKHNLVFIYLESLERTYLNETVFPGLTPHLQRLEAEGIAFTNVAQLPGTEWTIAGMVGSQSGIPLVTPSEGNSMSGMDQFLPGAICMGDILNRAGYKLAYVGGASLEFAGKGTFYKTHGFDLIRGAEDLGSTEETVGSGWGIYDDTLFKEVALAAETLGSQNEPFALFTLTLDTHHPTGHISPSCRDVIYGEGDNPILNAVHCSDRLVGELVSNIRRGINGTNTVIVVASDHLAMRNTAFETLKRQDRKNLLIAIPPKSTEGLKVERLGSTFDIAATVMPMLGFETQAIGYGRNLLSTEQTLMESSQNPYSEVQRNASFFSSYWRYPGLTNGLLIDGDTQVALMGTRIIKLPALIGLNENMEVEDIKFEFTSAKKLSSYVEDAGESPYIWIDKCSSIDPTQTENGTSDTSLYCAALKRDGTTSPSVVAVNHGLFISRAEIQDLTRSTAVIHTTGGVLSKGKL